MTSVNIIIMFYVYQLLSGYCAVVVCVWLNFQTCTTEISFSAGNQQFMQSGPKRKSLPNYQKILL